MLSSRVLRGVVDGRITLAFRRWASPQARTGSRLRTAAGVIAIGAVEAVEPETITDDEARQAGFDTAAGLRSSLDKHGTGRIYRIELGYAGPDPRVALREQAELSSSERADLDRRLARMDTSSQRGPWTRRMLELLRDNPGVRAAELAATQNRPVARFKSDVWKLKELGLTESLEVGYRLSPRGRSYLDSPT
ncbi:ASCH domain-containing protein [Saccharopolyspora erythraea]|uniref:ASCH domain-containing protein n=1 Tax=Saccharopolyspora erythraea TaxID=1836 RepID=UPI001BAAB193|nr:ASCH domain-containing protein [Saccharopolyspora erythraea]QUH06120.1 ASCH domain-containing protein [Saccharopolyspora erythraea]